jgi:hypothetical protein
MSDMAATEKEKEEAKESAKRRLATLDSVEMSLKAACPSFRQLEPKGATHRCQFIGFSGTCLDCMYPWRTVATEAVDAAKKALTKDFAHERTGDRLTEIVCQMYVRVQEERSSLKEQTRQAEEQLLGIHSVLANLKERLGVSTDEELEARQYINRLIKNGTIKNMDCFDCSDSEAEVFTDLELP